MPEPRWFHGTTAALESQIREGGLVAAVDEYSRHSVGGFFGAGIGQPPSVPVVWITPDRELARLYAASSILQAVALGRVRGRLPDGLVVEVDVGDRKVRRRGLTEDYYVEGDVAADGIVRLRRVDVRPLLPTIARGWAQVIAAGVVA